MKGDMTEIDICVRELDWKKSEWMKELRQAHDERTTLKLLGHDYHVLNLMVEKNGDGCVSMTCRLIEAKK